MVRNNRNIQKLEKTADRTQHYGIRKLTIGAVSVLLGTTLFLASGGMQVRADSTIASAPTSEKVNQNKQETNLDSAISPNKPEIVSQSQKQNQVEKDDLPKQTKEENKAQDDSLSEDKNEIKKDTASIVVPSSKTIPAKGTANNSAQNKVEINKQQIETNQLKINNQKDTGKTAVSGSQQKNIEKNILNVMARATSPSSKEKSVNHGESVQYTFNIIDGITGQAVHNGLTGDTVTATHYTFNSDDIGKTIGQAITSDAQYVNFIPQINGYKFTGDFQALKNTVISDHPQIITLKYTHLSPVVIRYWDDNDNKEITHVILPAQAVALASDPTGYWKGDNYVANPISKLNFPGLDNVPNYEPNIPGFTYTGRYDGIPEGQLKQTYKVIKKGTEYYLDSNPIFVTYHYKINDPVIAQYSLAHPQLGRTLRNDIGPEYGYVGDPINYTLANQGVINFIKRTGASYVGGINTKGGMVTSADNDVWYFFLGNRDVKVKYINKANNEILKQGYADIVSSTMSTHDSDDIRTTSDDMSTTNNLNGKWTTRKLSFPGMVFVGTNRSTSGIFGSLQQEVDYYYLPVATRQTEEKTVTRLIHYVANSVDGKQLQPDAIQQISLTGTYFVDAKGNRVNAEELKDIKGNVEKDATGNPIYVVVSGTAPETWTITVHTIPKDVTSNSDGTYTFNAATDAEKPLTINVDSAWSTAHNNVAVGTWTRTLSENNAIKMINPNTASFNKNGKLILDPIYLIYNLKPNQSGGNGGHKPVPTPTPTPSSKTNTEPGNNPSSSTTPANPIKPMNPTVPVKPTEPIKPTTPSKPTTPVEIKTTEHKTPTKENTSKKFSHKHIRINHDRKENVSPKYRHLTNRSKKISSKNRPLYENAIKNNGVQEKENVSPKYQSLADKSSKLDSTSMPLYEKRTINKGIKLADKATTSRRANSERSSELPQTGVKKNNTTIWGAILALAGLFGLGFVDRKKKRE